MHDDHPKEAKNPLIFIPVALFGIYLIYMAATLSYRTGMEVGLLKAPYKSPEVEQEADQVFDLNQLRKPNEELVALGARVYNANCAACHGQTGAGNGAAGVNLSVKPRNFTAGPDGWTNGASVLQMYTTLENGLGQMPNFPALNPEQKMATIHYIHAEFMADNYPQDPEEMIAALPAPSAGGGAVNIDPYAGERIPVRFAIQKLLRQNGQPAEDGE